MSTPGLTRFNVSRGRENGCLGACEAVIKSEDAESILLFFASCLQEKLTAEEQKEEEASPNSSVCTKFIMEAKFFVIFFQTTRETLNERNQKASSIACLSP